MASDEKKSLAAMIVGGAKPKADVVEEVEPKEESEVSGLDAAADEILSAFEAKDASGLKSALMSFVEMCGSGSEK